MIGLYMVKLHVCIYPSATYRGKKKKSSELVFGREVSAIPVQRIKAWQSEVLSACTGPNAGLTKLDIESKLTPSLTNEPLAGACNWNSPSDHTYGISLSLYEEDKTKNQTEIVNGKTVLKPFIVGEPNADVFGIQTRENSCILAIADGVNWGKKSRLAARCAVYAVMEHVTSNFDKMQDQPTSATIAQLLFDAVTVKAHDLILKCHATLTTLSAAAVCEMDTPGEWGLFVCSVGDSPVYIYCPHTRKIIEATVGGHDQDGGRDMRMAGGVLGPSYGSHPDLGNLTVSYLPVYDGDIIISMSDGVADNFSSKVMAGLMAERDNSLPEQKVPLSTCCENVLHMTAVLNNHQDKLSHNMSAQTVTACLVNHAVEVTESKRTLRSHCIEQNIDLRRESLTNPEFAARLNAATGKLDHATVVAYQVGHH